MANKLLRTDLPPDVWERLNAEAAEHGKTIGVYVKNLIIRRDERMQSKVSGNGATPSTPTR